METTSSFDFTLNGSTVRVCGQSPNTTLLQYLRATGRTGSKEGCAEGDCGACTVALVETNARGVRTYRAINACIALLPMFAGREVVTVEGLAREGEPLHPVQQSMVDHYGSQCGYCTPGFVVSMFEAYYRDDLEKRWQETDQLSGNLCRCTGYRPIRDALASALAKKDPARADLFELRLRKPSEPLAPFAYEADGQSFLRPTSLRELLSLRAARPDAELVAGATELGVYVNKKGARYPLLVSIEAVPELVAITKTTDAFEIGGAATLTALYEALAGEFPSIDKMLSVFASRQIRNRATLAGNLVTASPIGDMAPVLLSLDARLVLASAHGERTVALSDFFLGYRKTALAKDEILRTIVLPRTSKTELRRSESYKVSKRRELDISIVAAGFTIERDGANVVRHARLAYGGVAATPARARRTEAFLVGRPWTAETLAEALPILGAEFAPIDDVRSGASYRRGLVTSLFEKFFSGQTSAAQDEPLSFVTGAPNPDGASPSHALEHESVRGHVTGGAVYVDDQAKRREMLELWPVTSPHAHARIVSIDTGSALKMPGVVAILTAKDIPGENDVGAIRKDETLLANGEVLFHGHMVAVVVGESYAACRLAAAEVKVQYEPLTAIVSLRQAIERESYHTAPHTISRGDADLALANSTHTLRGELSIGGQEHLYLEAQAAWAEPGDDGDVFVVSSTQHPSEVQAVVAHVLHVNRNKVVVQAPRMGGGFGGKETQGNSWAALAALAAVTTRRPVRVQLDRDLDMQLTGKRHPFVAELEAGFDAEGRLSAAKIDLVADGGWALDLSESIADRALFHLDNAYYVPSARFSSRVAKTHTVSHTAFRGFGGPQGMLVIEEILDRIARRLGLRPEVVRERNLYRGAGESNTTHYGQPLGDERLQTIWRSLATSSSLDARREQIAKYNADSPNVKRGIAMTPLKFGISFTASFLNQAGALVHVYRDGSVQVNHGGTEMGQGLYTKIRGIAMRELGLSAGRIRVMKTQTDKVPNTSATAASSGSDLNGAAVKDACDKLKERLVPFACELFAAKSGSRVDPSTVTFADDAVSSTAAPEITIPFEAVVDRAYMGQASLSATGFYKTPGIGYDRAKGRGKPFYYFTYGAAVAEVTIDGFTGMKRVLRVDILQDVGRSLNPGIDRGQIEGAFVQGMGWLTGEELKWDPEGRLSSHSASTYPIPAIGDAPADMRVALLPRADQEGVIHGSKAVGEPPLMLAISVREAIRDAIAAFGAPGGQVDLASPATHEEIFAQVKKRLA